MEMHLSRRARAILGLVAVGAGIPVVAIASVRLADAVGGVPVSVPTLSSGSTAATAGTAGSAGTSSSGSTSPQTVSGGSTSTSQNLPADKVTVAGSRAVVMSPQDDVVLLSAQMRTSNVADLVFSVTAECSVFTSVTSWNDSQEATAQVVMWVTVDGQAVGVEPASPGATLDNSQVTFCNRDYKLITAGLPSPSPSASPSPQITNWEKTLDANGFNWVALNVGNQVHTIQLHGMLTENVSDPSKDQAQAYVRARTMVINVTQNAANQAQ